MSFRRTYYGHILSFETVNELATCIQLNSSRDWYRLFPKKGLDVLRIFDSRSRVEVESPAQHARATWTPVYNPNFCGRWSFWWYCDKMIKKWVHCFIEHCAHLLAFEESNLMWDKHLRKWICSMEEKYGLYLLTLLQAKSVWHTSNWTIICKWWQSVSAVKHYCSAVNFKEKVEFHSLPFCKIRMCTRLVENYIN